MPRRPQFLALRPAALAALAGLAAFAGLAAASRSAGAATLSWANASGGSAATAGNWSPAQVPAAADALVFNLAGTYAIGFNSSVPTSASHQHRRGTVTLTCTPFHSVTGALSMGAASGDAPNVTLSSGTLSVAATSSIGSAAGSTAALEVSGFNTLFQVTNPAADLRVGVSGTGTLDILNGAIVRMADDLIIGDGTQGVGHVLVSGKSGDLPSTLRTENAGGDCWISQNGTGTLTLWKGGSVRIVEDTYIGYFGSGTGTLSVGDGVGASRFETVRRLYVGANDVPGSAAGTGTVQVNAGGTVVCTDTLAVGDPDPGPQATLRIQGGDVLTESLVVDSLQGNFDFNGGSVTVASGRARFGANLSLDAQNAVDDGEFRLRSGAIGTVKGGIFVNTGSARRFRFEVDSGSSLTATGLFGAFGENVDVVVDSSSSLVIGGRFYLGGSSNQTTLAIGVGSTVEAASMECTDGSGATSAMTISGAGAALRIRDNLIVGGDEAFVGGPSTVLVAGGGSIAPSFPTMNVRVRAPGFLDIASGGTVNATQRLLIEGRVRLQPGGVLTALDVDLDGTGRLEAKGVVAAPIGGTNPASAIVALGNLDLGTAASSAGFDFRGTLDAGPHSVRLFDANGCTLGDTTRVALGSIISATALTVPSTGVVSARGLIQTPLLTNNGKLIITPETIPTTLSVTGALTQSSTGTTLLRVKGPAAGETDRVIVSGTLSCGGTLHLVFLPGAAFPAGSYPLLTGSARTGTFSSVVIEGLVNPGAMSLLYTGTEVRLLVSTGVVDVPAGLDLPAELAFRGLGGSRGAAFELALPAASDVTLELFDVTGRSVGGRPTQGLVAGRHRFPVDALLSGRAHRAPGVYFARVRVRAGTGTERLLHDRVVVLD